GLASAAFLMVDDFDAAQIRHRQSVRLPAPACGTRVCDEFDRGHDQSGRKLCRFSYRVILSVALICVRAFHAPEPLGGGQVGVLWTSRNMYEDEDVFDRLRVT